MTQPQEDELREMITRIEVTSAVAMQLSMQDGDPKHHEKFFRESAVLIQAYVDKKVREARIEELERIDPDFYYTVTYQGENGKVKVRRFEDLEKRINELKSLDTPKEEA